MPSSELTTVIAAVLGNAPQWIRADLSSKDAKLRLRAEDALSAIIASALVDAQGLTFSEPSRH